MRAIKAKGESARAMGLPPRKTTEVVVVVPMSNFPASLTHGPRPCVSPLPAEEAADYGYSALANGSKAIQEGGESHTAVHRTSGEVHMARYRDLWDWGYGKRDIRTEIAKSAMRGNSALSCITDRSKSYKLAAAQPANCMMYRRQFIGLREAAACVCGVNW